MLCKLPDIDIPAVTNILHAVAFREFKQHVERLSVHRVFTLQIRNAYFGRLLFRACQIYLSASSPAI